MARRFILTVLTAMILFSGFAFAQSSKFQKGDRIFILSHAENLDSIIEQNGFSNLAGRFFLIRIDNENFPALLMRKSEQLQGVFIEELIGVIERPRFIKGKGLNGVARSARPEDLK